MISEKYSSMKTGLLEKMPPMAVEGEAEPAKESPAQVTPPGRVVHVPTQQQPLLKVGAVGGVVEWWAEWWLEWWAEWWKKWWVGW